MERNPQRKDAADRSAKICAAISKKREKNLTSKRPFYRNLFELEVLSEEPLSGDENLTQIDFLVSTSCSGKLETIVANEQVSGERMAQLLLAQDSDTEFFGLDQQGNDLYTNEEEEQEEGRDGTTQG